jgi:cytochrome c peroxidase
LKAAYEQFLGPAADQALSPFSNDVEQNVPDGNDNGLPGAEAVCRRVKAEDYAELFEFAWGEPIDCGPTRVDISFKRIAVAIAAWEQSSEVNSFSSRRDWALANDRDNTPQAFPLQWLTNQENQGHDLFYGITSSRNPNGKNAQCSVCHNSEGPSSQGNEPGQLYTDQTFHHLGLPPNYEIANFDVNDPDRGLAEFTDSESPAATERDGHFRTPTLRNVDKRTGAGFVKAYMHNGYFKSLEDVVHFYNTASVKEDSRACPPGTTAAQARARDCWPAAETAPHVGSARGTPFVGNLGLTAQEEAAIVAYLKTLSDTTFVARPVPYKLQQHFRKVKARGVEPRNRNEFAKALWRRWWVVALP